MKCDHCGIFNVDEAEYCRGCGKQLNNNLGSTNGNVPTNEKESITPKSPLYGLKTKLDQLSYAIIVLTGSLILCAWLPFIESTDYDQYASIIDILILPELGAILLFSFSVLGVICAVKRKPIFNIALPSVLLWVWSICNTVSEWVLYHNYELAVGGWMYCVVPFIVCCLSIKQRSLLKSINDFTLYYKANGIMEYTSKDFCVCPSCKQSEFIKEAGYCRNCGFEGSYKSVKDLYYIVLACGLGNLIAVLLATNSNWVEIFDISHIGSRTEKVQSLDTTMSLIYWINFVLWVIPGIAARELNKNALLFISVPYVVMNIAMIYHTFSLADIVPYIYKQGCTLFGWVLVIGCIIEIIVIIRKWKNVKPFFCQ